ncbi:MAG: CotH kinase family protein [Bacteroidaceae bacterium]|nr:CotH kinase family protein [Bacteroidaceae bacterium]
MKTPFRIIFCAFLAFFAVGGSAQDVMRIHHKYDGVDWSIPLLIEKLSYMELQGDEWLQARFEKADGGEIVVPYSVAAIDSIDFAYSLTDEEKGHNKYRVFSMHIDTEDHQGITVKEEWLPCHISIDGMGEYSDYSGTGRIRGRGNSSWTYYKKKPYKFKLDKKSKLLGLEKAKNWNLLSNYRDVTDMMNVFAFEAARYMGMPFTNHTRFVEVFLNGEYVGVYQLTEKIEIGESRVNIDPLEGVLIGIDLDDGPSLSPDATDNFWSEVYSLPLCVKEPEGLTQEQLDAVKADFAVLENAIKSADYDQVASLMDIPSFIALLQLHEYLYNVEIDAPRSIYMHKDKDGKYTFGPVWDWDAAYDFDWNNWTENHTYFSDYKELIYGTNPLKATGANYHINKFFRNMFSNAAFVTQYKATWAALSDSVFLQPWSVVQKYIDEMDKGGAYARDVAKWPLENPNQWEPDYVVKDEIEKMKTYLQKRKTYLDGVIAAYPDGDETTVLAEPTTTIENGTVRVKATMDFGSGYSQDYRIKLPEDDIVALLGGTPTSLVPLNADGSEGDNTAAKQYGAWFDADGNTASYYWGNVHVYIESDELYSWAYGCHPTNCAKGDTHTVRMQYQRGSKRLVVIVTFNMV